ncbi:MAG: hypothetical protein KL863_09820 [Rhizobium sp.]|nr:hypothetical protein [Rhizobium sp.]
MDEKSKEPTPVKPGDATPPAGPHAKKSLTDTEKTPGTGSLPDPDQPEADVGPD